MSLLKKIISQATVIEPTTSMLQGKSDHEVLGKFPEDVTVDLPPAPYPQKRTRPSTLTAEVERTILQHIELGAFPRAAAQAAGITAATFDQWMRHTGEEYQSFQSKINQASMAARVQAELLVKVSDPKFWLTHGPGRDKPEEPGWGPAKQQIEGKISHAHMHIAPQWDLSKLSDEELDLLDKMTSKAQLTSGDVNGDVIDAELVEDE